MGLQIVSFNESASNDFQELKTKAQANYARAKDLLPGLQQAQQTAADAEQPAAEAERLWQEAHARLQAVSGSAQTALASLQEAVTAAAGSEQTATTSLAQHLAQDRLEHFRIHHLTTARQWQAFPAQELPLFSIPGGKVVAKLAACEAEDGSKYGVLSVTLAAPFLSPNRVHGALLHWGCSEGPHTAFAQPPPGWHTLPCVSEPSGDNKAWQTPMACCAPVVGGSVVGASAADVLSVVVQVPLEGVLAVRGGIKFVVKRSDGAPPEWVKAGYHNHGDFFVDLTPAIHLFGAQRAAAQAATLAAAAAAQEEAVLAAAAVEVAATEAARWAAGGGQGGEDSEHEELTALEAEWGVAGHCDEWEEWALAGKQATTAAAELQGEPATAATVASTAKAPGAAPPPEPVPKPPSCAAQAAAQATAAAKKAAAAAEAAAAAAITAAQVPAGPDLPGWLARVERWEQLVDYPPSPAPSHAQRVAALELLAQAMDPSGQARLPGLSATAEEAVAAFDAAELEAQHAQQEKERLQGLHRGASEQTSHLQHEVSTALELARRAVVNLHGRQVEVTQRDLEGLASQQAEALAKSLQEEVQQEKKKRQPGGFWPFNKPKPEERQLVFVQQKVMRVAGLEANLLAQIYVEGPKAAAAAPAAGGADDSASSSGGARGEADSRPSPLESLESVDLVENGKGMRKGKRKEREKEKEQGQEKEKEAAAPPKPVFDSVIVSVAVAEEFPSGRLPEPLVLHLGAVAHQYAGWQAPPGDWRCTGDEGKRTHNTAAQVPLQRFTITREDGSPAFVDPALFALAIRLPLADCQEHGVRGLEFVLNAQGHWLSWQHGHGGSSNFYSELPLPLL